MKTTPYYTNVLVFLTEIFLQIALTSEFSVLTKFTK
jgi:hypothetical protein